MPMPQQFNCNLLPNKITTFKNPEAIKQQMGWQITAFNLPAPWQHSCGEGVKYAVIDSGCDLNHDDLKNNLLPGRNFIDPSMPPFDDLGHGSHVAGIICAENNGIGMIGIAPKSKVIPVKVMNSKGKGDLRLVADAIRWSTDQGVDFIILSVGCPNPVDVIWKAIQYAVSHNAVVLCAAGNAGRDKKVFYPAAYPEVIAVGAIDRSFNLAKFSCSGHEIDFLAPGVKIVSTIPVNTYGLMSGTSMATPFLGGICGLLLSYVRKNKLNVVLNNRDDYCGILKKYTTSINNPQFAGKEFFEGFGIIDPRKLEEWIELNK